jgi:hypothetical protein
MIAMMAMSRNKSDRISLAVVHRTRKGDDMKKLLVFALLAAGCGSGYTPAPVNPGPPGTQDAFISGQYNMVLTSSDGHGTTNVYTNFTQSDNAFTGTASTLVCPGNELSQCEGRDASAVSITPSGMISASKVTMTISFPTTAGSDTVNMVGTVTGTNLAGTYTDSLGDAGTWAASVAIHPFASPPSVYNYGGTFNSTSHPLLIAPTISVQLGEDVTSDDRSKLSGSATILNSPCISALAFSGQAIGDAFSLTDTASKAHVLALPTHPTVPTDNSFIFSYSFESTAASCAGDSGRGVVTITGSPWDYVRKPPVS